MAYLSAAGELYRNGEWTRRKLERYYERVNRRTDAVLIMPYLIQGKIDGNDAYSVCYVVLGDASTEVCRMEYGKIKWARKEAV